MGTGPNIVVAFNEYVTGLTGLGIAHTYDGFATVFNTNTPGIWAIDGDPSVAADTQGNVFAGILSFASSGPIFPNNGIYVSLSSDGGTTWSTPVTIDQFLVGSSPVFFTDKPYLTVDTYTSSPYTDNIYIIWQRDDTNGVNSDIYFARSSNTGASFNFATTGSPAGISGKISDLPSTPQGPGGTITPWSSQGNGPVPAVAPDGTVYAAWQDAPLCIQGPGRIYVDKSTDGGVTFGTDVLAANYWTTARWPKGGASFVVRSFPSIAVSPQLNPQSNYDVYIVYAENPDANPDIRLDSDTPAGGNISAAPQISSQGNNVYTVWEDTRNGWGDIYFNSSANNGISWRDGPDDGDIMLIRSADGGNTWSTPVTVNNDTTTNGQFQPWIDVKPNGTIDVVWYDRRNDPNDSLLEVYMGTSTDRGVTFTNTLVSDVSFGPPGGGTVWPWMGEYIGIDVDSTDAYIVWTDTRTRTGAATGDRDIYFDQMPNPEEDPASTLTATITTITSTSQQVQALPILKKGEIISLTKKLEGASAKIAGAIDELQDSYERMAVNLLNASENKLSAFNNEVEAKIRSGKIDPDTGELLTTQIDEIINILEDIISRL